MCVFLALRDRNGPTPPPFDAKFVFWGFRGRHDWIILVAVARNGCRQQFAGKEGP
jgi:hypothetical protein